MILEILSKKDKTWRDIAFNITKNKQLADELVQEMYLRIYDYNVSSEKLTNSFIRVVLYNLFKDSKKNNKEVELKFCKEDEDETIEINDKQFLYLCKAESLTTEEKQLLILSFDNSLREIADIYNVTYQTIYRRLANARVKVLKQNYSKEYNNKRKKR